jgi:hypothetical protein
MLAIIFLFGSQSLRLEYSYRMLEEPKSQLYVTKAAVYAFLHEF